MGWERPLLLETRFLDQPQNYDGTQLAPHWIYRNSGIQGNALVAFTGEAEVSLDHLVDLEDVRKKAPIYSPAMLHFIGEWFIDSLDQGILLQHLFTSAAYEHLWEVGVRDLAKRGNDLFFKDRKLSVSVATKSSISVLMHTGLNIRSEGTPIPTSCLSELGLDPKAFAVAVLNRFQSDSAIWAKARVKVSPR
jgi:uncharacterized protein